MEEDRCADERGDDAQGDFSGGGGAGDVVDGEHETAAENHRAGEEGEVVGAHEEAAHVGDDEADPTDDAAQGHGSGGEECGGDDDGEAHARGVDAEGLCFFFAEGHDVEFPAQHHEGDSAREKDDRHDGEILGRRRAGETTHQPEGDFGQFGFGWGEVFRQ